VQEGILHCRGKTDCLVTPMFYRWYGHSTMEVDGGNRVVIDESEAEIVVRIFRMTAEGCSYKQSPKHSARDEGSSVRGWALSVVVAASLPTRALPGQHNNRHSERSLAKEEIPPVSFSTYRATLLRFYSSFPA
jgi:hypothetical protein